MNMSVMRRADFGAQQFDQRGGDDAILRGALGEVRDVGREFVAGRRDVGRRLRRNEARRDACARASALSKASIARMSASTEK